jgi:hypothetical protein
MRGLASIATVALMTIALATASPAGAQRGQSNGPAAARAPRTADGKPDLSGVWELRKDRPCPKDGCPDMQLSEQFFNIGYGVQGGLPYQPWAAALVKERTAKFGGEDPTSRCIPGGVVRWFTWPYYNKIVQTPGLIIVLNEREAGFREIFTDGRSVPGDVIPGFKGYSIGTWQGDTLVVRTTGFRDGLWLDRAGSPVTDAATITERFRRPDADHLEIEITVDDSKAYTRPWTTKIVQALIPKGELAEFICLENQRQ